MSSKTQTTSTQTNSYNQASMDAYNKLQPQTSSLLTQYMQDPRTSGMFNLRLQQANAGVNQLGQQGASRIQQNLVAGGFGGSNMNAFQQSALAANARQTSANKSQAYIQNLLGQQQLQQNAMTQAMGYKPLQTGGTTDQTQTKSGLGTWLPQVAGAALSGAMALGTGGTSLGFQGIAGSLGSAGNMLEAGLPAANFSSLMNLSPGMAGIGGNSFFAGLQ